MSAGILVLLLGLTVVATCIAAERPILLFSREDNAASPRLALTAEGQAFLESLPAPFAIISAVGPTRTGKSFLLNQLSDVRFGSNITGATAASPFAVGSGVVSHTHGLWIWPESVTRQNGIPIYLVDSEGLHGVESVQSSAYEVELFVHATMLSSSLIYNTWAPMDAADVRTLKSLTAFARLFMMDVAAAAENTESKNGNELLAANPGSVDSPTLHWVVQNFNKHALNRANWTPAEFLDQLIRKDAFLENAEVDLQFLHQQFRSLELVPLSRPSDDDSIMAGNGDDVTWDDFRQEYRQDLATLAGTLRQSIRPKSLNGVPLSGRELVCLLKKSESAGPIQIPEHTAWDRAVHMKLEYEGQRLLNSFSMLAETVSVQVTATFELYAAKIKALANRHILSMRKSVASLGEDSTAMMAATHLEKQLDAKVSDLLAGFITYSEHQVKVLCDQEHERFLQYLAQYSRSSKLCDEWWLQSSLRKHLDRRISAHWAKLRTIRHKLPAQYDDRQLQALHHAGTGLAHERAHQIQAMRNDILLAHFECPNPVDRTINIVGPFLNRHRQLVVAFGSIVVALSAFHFRHQLLSYIFRFAAGLGRVASRIFQDFAAFAIPILIVTYILWIVVQFYILGRPTSEVRYTPAGAVEEWVTAKQTMSSVFTGIVSLTTVVGGLAVFLSSTSAAPALTQNCPGESPRGSMSEADHDETGADSHYDDEHSTTDEAPLQRGSDAHAGASGAGREPANDTAGRGHALHDDGDNEEEEESHEGEEDEEDAEEEETAGDTVSSILGSMVESKQSGAGGAPGGDLDSRRLAELSDTDEEDPSQAQRDAKPTSASEKPGDVVEAGDAAMDEIQNTLEFMATQPAPGQAGADPSFVRLRSEYDKLHRLFLQSRKNEKSLVQKCKDFASEIAANSAKVQAALKLSQNDRSQIITLKKEVRKAWKMVEASGEKEGKAKDVIASLKSEVEQLRRQITEMGSGAAGGTAGALGALGRDQLIEMQIEQEKEIKQLTEARDSLQKQLAIVSSDTETLRTENDEYSVKIERLVSDRGTVAEELLTLKDLLATKKSELDREVRAREKLEAALKQSNEACLHKDDEVAAKVADIRALRETIVKLEQACKDERTRVEKSEKDKENMNARLARLQQEYDEQVLTTTRLLSENQQQTGEIKSWEEELTKYKEEYRSVTRVRDTLQKRIKAVEESKLEAEVERDQLKGANHNLAQDLDVARRNLDISHKQVDSLTRERDIAQKNFVKATGTTQKQITVVKLADQTKRNLEQEIMGYKDEATKTRKLIYSLEKDRDRHINEAGKARLELMSKEEELKIGEMIMFDSRKKIGELEKRLKEAQAVYETMRGERNFYSKNLVESQDEITEMKRKVKIMSHQIEQLKEEIASKEGALVKEHFEHSKLEKAKEVLSVQIGKLQLQYEDAQQMIQNQQSEESKLRHIISTADTDRLRQKKEYETLVQERDILGTQLIRRNDELSLLYEKIKIQTSTLHKGELQYRERLEDIRVCKLEIKKLRREKAILQTETQNVDGLRADIFRLQREVLRERTRVKVLEEHLLIEELSSPLNIHRWRKLCGSDPSTYELITKIQTLQKRLIAKTEQVVEKELVIHQKEKLYKEVKDVLQRQPGPEVMEELRVVREAVRGKVRECKALASELNMYHSQVNEYKYEIERVNRELQDLKKKYYESRKNRVAIPALTSALTASSAAASHLGTAAWRTAVTPRTMMGKDRTDAHAGNPALRPHPGQGPRFSGGGFNMSTGPSGPPGAATVQSPPQPGGEESVPVQ
ncbi:hypothetical protein HDU86_005253 [Geranomyces michiganensis]|nr:hypothetical protein HDU86_005253 [Geranomyces michiganensis]